MVTVVAVTAVVVIMAVAVVMVMTVVMVMVGVDILIVMECWSMYKWVKVVGVGGRLACGGVGWGWRGSRWDWG